MSVQSEIDRIKKNVNDTLKTISDTGVTVGAGSDSLPTAAAALANEKQDKATAVTVPGSGTMQMSESIGTGPYTIEFDEEADEAFPASLVDYNNTTSGMAATTVQAAVDELFTSVSEGKSLIAAAVTDKGVETAATDSFAAMAEKIGKIVTGEAIEKGSLYIESNHYYAYLPDGTKLNGATDVTTLPIGSMFMLVSKSFSYGVGDDDIYYGGAEPVTSEILSITIGLSDKETQARLFRTTGSDEQIMAL